MKHALLIAKRDLRMYFVSPIAYLVMAAFLCLIGWMFFNLLSYYSAQLQEYARVSFGAKPNISDGVIRPLFGNMNVLILIFTPFLTMRSFAEERKDHTLELLLTAPIRTWEIVLGKFLAPFSFLAILLSITLVYPLLLQTMAKPDWGVFFTSYMGVLLASATYVGVGLFWSSTTENQIVAGALSFGTLLFFWLISWVTHRTGSFWSDVLNHLSIVGHFSNFAMGVLDSSDVIFYLSFTFFALFLSYLSLDLDQWG